MAWRSKIERQDRCTWLLSKFPSSIHIVLFYPIFCLVSFSVQISQSQYSKIVKLTTYGNTGCEVFKGGIQNEKGFWLKINCSQTKSLNFANRCNGEVSKSAKIWLSKSIFYIKNHPNLSDFFSLKNKNLEAHYMLLTFFDNINFYITLFSKMMPKFWQLATTPILKTQ